MGVAGHGGARTAGFLGGAAQEVHGVSFGGNRSTGFAATFRPNATFHESLDSQR